MMLLFFSCGVRRRFLESEATFEGDGIGWRMSVTIAQGEGKFAWKPLCRDPYVRVASSHQT